MPRPRPPHLHRERTRHGEWVWYVRIGKGPRMRVRGEYGTEAFQASYMAAINGEAPPATGKPRVNTLEWLIARYRDSAAWTNGLSLATRRQRENIFRHVIKTAGRESISKIDRKAMSAGYERRRDTPSAARHFVQAMRGLFQWAVKAGHADIDPTSEIEALRPQTEGFTTWPAEWCAAFEQRWPLGTRERVAYDVLLETGLRRGDAVRMGRPHVRDGIGTIRTEKTGEVVTIVVSPALRASLDAGPVGELTYIAGERGKPMTKESFGNWFREACEAAGVAGSAHGLRKTKATIAAERGATVNELDAMFGWRGGKMAARYTEKADRAKLAIAAAKKIEAERPANIYSRTLASGAGSNAKKKARPKR
jgi:integrase